MRRRSRRLRFWVDRGAVAAGVLATIAGCSAWPESPEKADPVPRARIAEAAMVLAPGAAPAAGMGRVDVLRDHTIALSGCRMDFFADEVLLVSIHVAEGVALQLPVGPKRLRVDLTGPFLCPTQSAYATGVVDPARRLTVRLGITGGSPFITTRDP